VAEHPVLPDAVERAGDRQQHRGAPGADASCHDTLTSVEKISIAICQIVQHVEQKYVPQSVRLRRLRNRLSNEPVCLQADLPPKPAARTTARGNAVRDFPAGWVFTKTCS